MKVLLLISLLLNVGLGIGLLQKKSGPPIERIVFKHPPAVKRTQKEPALIRQAPPVSTPKGPAPVAIEDERSFQLAGEDLASQQARYLEELEMAPDALQRKEKLLRDFYDQTGAIYRKHPYGQGLSFKERRRVIELEEKLHRDYEQLFGARRWAKYKKSVDEYNQKLIQNHKSSDFSPLMMNY